MRVSGRKGTVYLHDYIGSDMLTGKGVSSRDLIEQLSRHGDLSDIELHINSAGGSAFDGIAMHNALKQHPAKVTVEIDSLAGSAASVVAMAGDTIRMATGSMLMIHNPKAVAAGESKDLRKRAEMLDRVRDSAIQIYAAKSGKTAEEIGPLLDAETWMNADEAREFGFVDEVVERPAIAACLDLSGYDSVPRDVLKLLSSKGPQMADKKDAKTTPEATPADDETVVVEQPAEKPVEQPKAPEQLATDASMLVQTNVQALIAAERKRVQAINTLCRQADVPLAKEKELIESGASLDAANAAVLTHMLVTRKPVPDDGETPEEDADAKLKAEYKTYCNDVKQCGLKPKSEEAYIRSRKIDTGELSFTNI